MRLVCEERLNQLPLRAWRTEEIGKTDDYGHFNVRLSFLLVKSEKHCVTAMKRFSELMAALGVKPSDFSCGQPQIPRSTRLSLPRRRMSDKATASCPLGFTSPRNTFRSFAEN